jgi:hypothetical protein
VAPKRLSNFARKTRAKFSRVGLAMQRLGRLSSSRISSFSENRYPKRPALLLALVALVLADLLSEFVLNKGLPP